MKYKIVSLVPLFAFALSSCVIGEPISFKFIKFNSYEDLVLDLTLENEYKKGIKKDFTDLYTNYPMCNLKLDDALETFYYKCGIDITPSLDFDTSGVRVIRGRYIKIENIFNDNSIKFTFKNSRNWEECEYDISTFRWEYFGGETFSQSLISAGYYKFANYYGLVDRNDDNVVSFTIYSNEDIHQSIFNKYKSFVEEKCKDIFK